MASDEVSIMVHKDPPQKQLVFPEGLEPRDKQRTDKKKLFVLTITPVSLYPMVFREAKRKQEWSEIETRKRGRKDQYQVKCLYFYHPSVLIVNKVNFP